jgi:hypothetical protein
MAEGDQRVGACDELSEYEETHAPAVPMAEGKP